MAVFKKIMIERTACLGSCPVYRAEVNAEGTVSYQGTAFVKKEGEHHWKIFQAQIDQLNDAIEQHQYFKIPEYDTDINITDAPSCIIRVVMEDGKERITVNNAAEGRYPERLGTFENLIDKIIGTAGIKSN